MTEDSRITRRPLDPIDPNDPVSHLDDGKLIDHAHGWTEVALSFLTTSAGAKLFSTIVGDPIQEKQKRVMNHFFGRVKSLEDAGHITLEDFENNESVASAIRALASQCLDTVSEEKIASLQNAMLNQVIITLDEIYIDDVISSLKVIRPIEIKVLRILNNPELSEVTPETICGGGHTRDGRPYPTQYSGISLSKLLTETFPEYRDKSIVINAYNSLVTKQLAVQVELDKGDYFPRGMGPPDPSRRSSYATKIGSMVVKYCENPEQKFKSFATYTAVA